MTGIRILAVSGVLMAAASAGAAEPKSPEVEIGLRGDAWFADLDGDVLAQSAGFTGTRMSYDALGMDTSETVPVVEGFLRFGWERGMRHRLSARYWEQSFEGQTILTQAFTFKNLVFAASTQVQSRLEFREFDLRYRYEFWQAEPARRIGEHPSAAWGVFALKGLDLESEVSAASVGTASKDAQGVFPALGLGGRFALGRRFGLEAEALGTKADVSDLDLSFHEVSVLARWDLCTYAALEAGWRRWSLDFDLSGSTAVDGDAVLEGAFAGLELRF